uniref:Serine/threonine-protein phosphatase 2A regulatory subunit B'' subunit alpha/beta/delta EF-hand domain-containing protein n=1 Tax=Pan troglodytes TaxID=9598 RepID=A0A2I3RQF0_PANTR
MPPGKVLQPVLKMKVDELFLYWLSEASTQRMLQDCLRRIKAPGRDQPTAGDGEQPGAWPTAPLAAPRPSGLEPPGTPGPGPALPAGAASSPRNAPHGRGTRRSAGTKVVQTRKEEPLPPATSQSIPTFYFPRGHPQDSINVDAVISKIESTFARFPHERATMDDMGLVPKACGCPLYWKGPLFCGAGGECTGSVSVHKSVAMWRKILQNCHDDTAKFVHLLMSPSCSYLVQEDFVPFLQPHSQKKGSTTRYCCGHASAPHPVHSPRPRALGPTQHQHSPNPVYPQAPEHSLKSLLLASLHNLRGGHSISFCDVKTPPETVNGISNRTAPSSINYPGDGAASSSSINYPGNGLRPPPSTTQGTGCILPHQLPRERAVSSSINYPGNRLRRLRGLSRAGGWPPSSLHFPENMTRSVPLATSSPSPRCRFEAELSPVEQKLSALRSPLAQRPFFEAPSPLGAVDLYEYACGDEALEPL